MEICVQILNSFSIYRLKSERYLNEEQGVNIDQSSMCSISMDSLQTNGKLFIKFQDHFSN